MFNFILEDHDVGLCFPVEQNITETKMGRWLSENDINYKISSFEEDYAMNSNNNLHAVYIIESLEFFSEEDMIAFKLRWS